MFFKTILSSLVVCFGLFVNAQGIDTEHKEERSAAELAGDLNYILKASRNIKEVRYEGIRGTPYRYEDFDKIILFDASMRSYPLDSANYNGFSNHFDFYHEGVLRELNGNNFLRVEVPQAEGEHHIYARGLNVKFPESYARIVYQGENIIATLIYNVLNDEKIVENPGQTLKLQRFSAKSLYYAMVDGEFMTLKLTAKSLAEDLGFPAELKKFIKKEKLKPGKDEDLIRIFAAADEMF